jgi:5'(3')-deoxyribonucleotidase
MDKKTVFIDLDDTLADFQGSPAFHAGFDVPKMYEPGFFFNLKPVEGALVAVRQIIAMGYDVHILSKPAYLSPHSYIEKVQWVGVYFPELIGKLHLTQYKGFFVGDYLVDDDYHQWCEAFEKNGGHFVHFDYVHKPKDGHDNRRSWENVVRFFKEEKENGFPSANKISKVQSRF